jgi:hypothetical protein
MASAFGRCLKPCPSFPEVEHEPDKVRDKVDLVIPWDGCEEFTDFREEQNFVLIGFFITNFFYKSICQPGILEIFYSYL